MIVSRFVEGKNKKWYLEVDGVPFLFNAIQSCCPPDKNYEAIMCMGSKAEFKILSLQIYWKDLEPKPGHYDFRLLDELIQYAECYDMRLDIVWAGTNYMGKMDPRFTPKWVLGREEWLFKSSDGKPLLVNSGDTGNCFVVYCRSETLMEAEQSVLKRMVMHLKEKDRHHRFVSIQLENGINMTQYPGSKAATLQYIDHLAECLLSLDYQLALLLNTAMWRQNGFEADLQQLKFIHGQGLALFTHRVSVTRTTIQDAKEQYFKCISCNSAYENTTAHMVTALCNGGFYHLYQLMEDELWDRPGLYDKNGELTPAAIKTRDLNHALNKAVHIIATTAPQNMMEFNTDTDGMPNMFYHDTKNLANVRIGFMPRCNAATGLAVYHEGAFYLFADAHACFCFPVYPLLIQKGYFQGESWVTVDTCSAQTYDMKYYINYNKGDCIKVVCK